jgi:hypothetical protein
LSGGQSWYSIVLSMKRSSGSLPYALTERCLVLDIVSQ